MPLFPVGTRVFVPASALPEPASRPFALVEKSVTRVEGRSVVVSDPGGTETKIGSSRVHPANLGLLIVRIGDLQTELTLLDPLASSVLQFFRLLLPDDQVLRLEVRTPDELVDFWGRHHAGYSHVVVVGHAGPTGMKFLGSVIAGRSFAQRLEQSEGAQTRPKEYISLACGSGRAIFAKELSQSRICSRLLAPYSSLHGAAGSHFAQTYFASRLLEGHTAKTAFNHAAEAVRGETHFRLWINGKIVAGRTT